MANDDEIKRLEETALAWPERAKAITITNQASYEQAASLVMDIVDVRKRIQEHHKPIKDAAHRAHKAAVEAEKKLLTPLQQAETILKQGIGKWDMEQERIRQEEQRKLEEAQRKADEEARLALATEAEAKGATQETVDEILETPVVKPIAIAGPTYERAAGISTSQRWHAEVLDLRALCLAVAQGRAPSNLVQANLPALNNMARAMKETFNVPGCRAVPEATVAVRR